METSACTICAVHHAVESGRWSLDDNPLVNAPHTLGDIAADDWEHAYTRQEAAFAVDWLRHDKYWPPVSRVDNVYGDRHLFCACPSIASFRDEDDKALAP